MGFSTIDPIRGENRIVKAPVVESDLNSGSSQRRHGNVNEFVTKRESDSRSPLLSELNEFDITICKRGSFIFIPSRGLWSLNVVGQRESRIDRLYELPCLS